MWLAGTEVADIYIGTRAFVASHNGDTPEACATGSLGESLRSLSEWMKNATRRTRLKIWLSGGLCRPFLLPELTGIRSQGELESAASALASRSTGLVGECRLWLDKNKTRNSELTVAVAVEAATIDKILATVRESDKKCRVSTIRPWWADSLRAALLREPELIALAAQDCDSLTLFTGSGLHFTATSTMTPILDRLTAEAALARYCMGAGLDEQQVLLSRFMPQKEPSDSNIDSAMAFGILTELSR